MQQRLGCGRRAPARCPRAMASAGWAKPTARPSTSTVPPAGRTEPESAANSSSWPWPSSATTPTTSPLRRSNETSCELGADPELADGKPRRAGRSARRLGRRLGWRRRALLDPGAEHQLDDALLDAGRDVDDADGLAVAQHGGAVAERRDLEEAVRDEDHRAAGLALPADDVEDALGEIGGQRRGHLVEQQHVGLDRPARGRDRARAAPRAGCRGRRRAGRGRGRRVRAPSRRNGLDRRARSAAGWRRRRGRGSATVPGRPGRGRPRRASAGERTSRGSPRTRMRPAFGRMAPVRILTSVDLPAPLAPISACTSPARTDSEAFRSAATAP